MKKRSHSDWLVPTVLMILISVGILLSSVYSGKPIDTATNCDGKHGPCKGSPVDKTRRLLGVP